MEIRIKALGGLKKYCPEERTIEVDSEDLSLSSLVYDTMGIPREVTRIGFVVNGRLQKSSNFVRPGDRIVFMVMGGAG